MKGTYERMKEKKKSTNQAGESSTCDGLDQDSSICFGGEPESESNPNEGEE